MKNTINEIEKFHSLMERSKNIYLCDIQKMDRAYNIIIENIENLTKH